MDANIPTNLPLLLLNHSSQNPPPPPAENPIPPLPPPPWWRENRMLTSGSVLEKEIARLSEEETMLRMGTVDKDEEINGEGSKIKPVVSIANFDYSVDNFVSYVGFVSEICGLPTGESNQRSKDEIARFSSMITFLKEWKHFVYEPKTVNFAYETEPGKFKDGFEGITLPQFSSAAVPKNEQSPNEATSLDRDFILNAGGLVWAFDWCPKNSGMDSSIQCEFTKHLAHKSNGTAQVWQNFFTRHSQYLAVAAHPPGSTYHKIGVPLLGRGIIQIWCLLTSKENIELSLLSLLMKGSARKNVFKEPTYDSEGKEVVKRPRGRPKKSATSGGHPNGPKEIIPANRKKVFKEPTYDLEGKDVVKRPRGRPKKSATSGGHPNGPKEIIPAKPLGRPRNKQISEKESSHITPRGRPKKRENIVAFPASSNEESCVKRTKRKPRKELKEIVNKCVQASGLELGESICALRSSRDPVTSNENAESLPEFSFNGNLETSFKRSTGRPRKGLPPSMDKCVQQSGLEIGNIISSLRTPTRLGISSEIVESQPMTEDFYKKMESSVIDFREGGSSTLPESQESETAVNRCVQASGIELGENVSALLYSRSSETFSRNGVSLPMLNSNGSFGSSLKRRRGRPRKGLTQNVDKCDQQTTSELGKTISSLSTSAGCGVLGEHVKSQFLSADLCNKMESSARTNSNDWVEDKELALTVMRTSDDQRNGEMVPRKEVTQVMSLDAKENSLPKLVLCLGHMGKVAWDVKWRPYNANDLEGKHCLGYLAALLGNGSLEVWEVPLPSIVCALFTSCRNEGFDPRFLKLKPIFRCSKVNNGNKQSIPLTLEWSTSPPHDLLLAGCHDGTVALWKFSTHHSDQDIKPLLCFSADSVPIRALSWAPDERDAESANLIVTAGHEGLKFWDIRDPYRPLWDMNPVQRIILSLDWLKEPRCLIWSYDDGTMRMLSLCKVANDVHVTGEISCATKQIGLHCYPCSASAVWSIQVSRSTGVASYCTADGSTCCFQLTSKSVEKDASRYREPHFLCGSLTKEDGVLRVNTPLPNFPLPKISAMKHPQNELGDARSLYNQLPYKNQAPLALVSVPDDPTPSKMKSTSKLGKCAKKTDSGDGSARKIIEELPPKEVAFHRVRWNMNEGSSRWLCSGGASGIIRCQMITLPGMQQGFTTK